MTKTEQFATKDTWQAGWV